MTPIMLLKPTSPKKDTPSGKIAMYAWGEDYHRIFKRKIKEFIKDLKELTGEETKTHWYTDTGHARK